MCKTLYQYDPQEADELSFTEGQMIEIVNEGTLCFLANICFNVLILFYRHHVFSHTLNEIQINQLFRIIIVFQPRRTVNISIDLMCICASVEQKRRSVDVIALMHVVITLFSLSINKFEDFSHFHENSVF